MKKKKLGHNGEIDGGDLNLQQNLLRQHMTTRNSVLLSCFALCTLMLFVKSDFLSPEAVDDAPCMCMQLRKPHYQTMPICMMQQAYQVSTWLQRSD